MGFASRRCEHLRHADGYRRCPGVKSRRRLCARQVSRPLPPTCQIHLAGATRPHHTRKERAVFPFRKISLRVCFCWFAFVEWMHPVRPFFGEDTIGDRSCYPPVLIACLTPPRVAERAVCRIVRLLEILNCIAKINLRPCRVAERTERVCTARCLEPFQCEPTACVDDRRQS